jgi:ribosomal-protein-alanine N-acetyltransferase
MSVEQMVTERLLLVPFTYEVASSLLEGHYDVVLRKGFFLGEGWPDEDAIETLPKIIYNLNAVGGEPSGFESWMIIRQDNRTIIGDTGFKGRPNADGEVDIGYAIIEKERKKGYGVEAAKGLAEWALSQPDVKAITAKCLLNNIDSAKVLVKMGFKETGRDGEYISWSIVK